MEKQPKSNGRIVDKNVALDTESVKVFLIDVYGRSCLIYEIMLIIRMLIRK